MGVLGTLRELVRDINFDVYSVPITVTRPAPNNTPISTTGIWLQPETIDVPGNQTIRGSMEFQRRESRRVLAISKAVVPEIERGTLITAPELLEGSARNWIVDGFERLDADHTRVVVVPAWDAS